jgi:hypothetical protein
MQLFSELEPCELRGPVELGVLMDHGPARFTWRAVRCGWIGRSRAPRLGARTVLCRRHTAEHQQTRA